MNADEQAAVTAWQADVESRTQGRCHPVRRGLRSTKTTAATAWRCEGRWQVDEQMDIWACIDEVELDERRKRGEDDDDED